MSEITEQVAAVTERDAEAGAKAPEVSVIIVSWNVADLLEQCIRSIVEHSGGVSFEVIVIDNASSDRSVRMLAEEFPWVRVIANEENVGFARANNQALPLAKGEFVFFLNPDTVLSSGALETMVEFLRNNPDVGVVGPRLVYADGSVQEPCARRLPTLTATLCWSVFKIGKLPLLTKRFSKRCFFPYDYGVSQEVEAISGAAMLFRGRVTNTLGGFGESFFHYGEDIDLCFRTRKEDWKIWYLPQANVTHYGGQSSVQTVVKTGVNTVLSVHEYFSRCFGRWYGLCYRLAVQFIQVPTLVLVGYGKFVMGLEDAITLRQRLKIAKELALWRMMR